MIALSITPRPSRSLRGLMTWLKTNSYTVVRLLLNQFGIAVMSIMLVAITQSPNQKHLMLLACVYATVFYLSLLYLAMWQEGAQDRIRVDAGRASPRRLQGLFLALAASIPNILIFLFMLVGYLFGSAAWAQGMYGIAHTAAVLWEGMYTGIINFILPPATTASMSIGYLIAYAITLLPTLLVCTLGYLMGHSERRLFGFLSSHKKR